MVISRSMNSAERLLESFHRSDPRRSHGTDWLASVRGKAADRARQLDFPERRNEDWRYSSASVAHLTALDLQPAATVSAVPKALKDLVIPGLDGPRLVFVNGVLLEGACRTAGLPAGVRVQSLAKALAEDPALVRAHWGDSTPSIEHAFGHLNTALFRDGAFVWIPRDVRLESPVELVFLTQSDGQAVASHVRNLIVAEPGSMVTVLELHGSAGGAGTFFSNVVTEASVGQGASLTHIKLHQESDETYHVSSVRARQAAQSCFANHFVGLGGGLVRNEVELRVEGEQASGLLNGVFVVDGDREVDNSTVIHHLVPNCTSHEVYKGVLGGRSQGTFKGKIFVHVDAQKTDAKQSSASLLLSDDATMNSQPNLEIYADDVRCTHGATVGQLRAEQLFYLRARGIGEAEARRMLTLAFVGDVLDGIEHEGVRGAVEQRSTLALDRILR